MSEVREVPRHYSKTSGQYVPSVPLPVHFTAIRKVERFVTSAVFLAATGPSGSTKKFTAKEIDDVLKTLSKDKSNPEVWLYNMRGVMKEVLGQTKKNTTPVGQSYGPRPKPSDRFASSDVLAALKTAMTDLESLNDPNDESGQLRLSIKEMSEHKTELEHALLSASFYV